MRGIFSLLFILGAVSLHAAGQRIGVVNVEKVFREYYKSKIAEGAIKQQAEIYRQHLLKLNEQLRQLEKEFGEARDKAQNLALADDVRKQAESSAKEKAQAVQAQRTSLRNYAADRRQKMQEFELQKRKEIISDITAEIKRRAAAGKYDLVLDIGGKTTNDIPAVVYHRPEHDMTQQVIKQLNAVSTTETGKK